MNIRPKHFVAARDFTHGRRSWRAGETIEHGLVLQRLLRHGDKFAVAVKSAPAAPQADPTGEAETTQKE